MRTARQIGEYEIAETLVLCLAEHSSYRFALLGFYDDDMDFLHSLQTALNVKDDKAWQNKLTKVVRRLVNYGVLTAGMYGTHKEYIGEPTKQMDYWLLPGKARLLTRGATDVTMSPKGEAKFLLRHAYPQPFEP